jgi:hypothetical protein
MRILLCAVPELEISRGRAAAQLILMAVGIQGRLLTSDRSVGERPVPAMSRLCL